MVVFADTSALYALANARDPNHDRARAGLAALLAAGDELLTHSYVIVETMALLQRRLGREVALRFASESRHLTIEWVGQETHERALQHLAQAGNRRLSLVDCTSFVVMRSHGVRVAPLTMTSNAKASFSMTRRQHGRPRSGFGHSPDPQVAAASEVQDLSAAVTPPRFSHCGTGDSGRNRSSTPAGCHEGQTLAY